MAILYLVMRRVARGFLYNLTRVQRWKSEKTQKGKVLEGFVFITAVMVIVMILGGDTLQDEERGSPRKCRDGKKIGEDKNPEKGNVLN